MRQHSESGIGLIAPFALRLQPELKARIEDAAAANRRSLNAEIARRVERSFEDLTDPVAPVDVRDHFAIAALIGLVTNPQSPSLNPPHDYPEAAAVVAYEYADAMLRARQPNPPTSPDKES